MFEIFGIEPRPFSYFNKPALMDWHDPILVHHMYANDHFGLRCVSGGSFNQSGSKAGG